MATLATVFGRFFARASERLEDSVHTRDEQTRVRPFPNEDIYFFTKRIDNTRVVRGQDPASSARAWKMIGTAAAAAVALIFILMPSAYGVLAGYKIQSLRQEVQRLSSEQSELEMQEAALLSPERMQELARMQQFVDPAPETVVYLTPGGDTEFAAANPRPARTR